LHDTFGIDVDDEALMKARSWRWLRTRISALLDTPPQHVSYGEFGGRLAAVPITRIGYALNPPKFSEK